MTKVNAKHTKFNYFFHSQTFAVAFDWLSMGRYNWAFSTEELKTNFFIFCFQQILQLKRLHLRVLRSQRSLTTSVQSASRPTRPSATSSSTWSRTTTTTSEISGTSSWAKLSRLVTVSSVSLKIRKIRLISKRYLILYKFKLKHYFQISFWKWFVVLFYN